MLQSDSGTEPYGQVSFEEFEVWWKTVEAEQLVGDMDATDVAEALAEAGIETKGGAALATMKEALKMHYSGKDVGAKEVFELLDADKSGTVDEQVG